MAPEDDHVGVGVQHVDDLARVGDGADLGAAGGGIDGVIVVQGEVGQDEDGDIRGGGLQVLRQFGDILFVVVIAVGLGDLAAAEAVDDVVLGPDGLAHLDEALRGVVLVIVVVEVAAGGGEPFVVAVGVNGGAHVPGVDLAVHVVHDLLGPLPEGVGGGGIGGAHVAAEAHGVDEAHVGLGGLQPGLQVEVLAVIVDVGGEGQGDGAVRVLDGALDDAGGLGELQLDLLGGFDLFAPAVDDDLAGIVLGGAFIESRAGKRQVVLGTVEGDGLGEGIVLEGTAAGVGHEAAGTGKDEFAGAALALHGDDVLDVGDPDDGVRRFGDLAVRHRDLFRPEAAFAQAQGIVLAVGLGDDDVLPAVAQRVIFFKGPLRRIRGEHAAGEGEDQRQDQQDRQGFLDCFHVFHLSFSYLVLCGNYTIELWILQEHCCRHEKVFVKNHPNSDGKPPAQSAGDFPFLQTCHLTGAVKSHAERAAGGRTPVSVSSSSTRDTGMISSFSRTSGDTSFRSGRLSAGI